MKTTLQCSLNQSSNPHPNNVTFSTQAKYPRKRPATQALQTAKNKRSKKSIPQLKVVTPILRKVDSVDNISPPRLDLQYQPYDKLWKSVKKNDVSSLQKLLTPTTSLNARYEKKGWTLLQYAVQLGHVDIVNFLIGQRVDIHAQTPEEGWSALHLACSLYSDKRSKERILILQRLVEAGANLNPVTKDGWTPLHWAAQQGSYNSVQCLIHEGAEVNSRTSYEEAPGEQGLTPLLLAIKNHHYNIVELLLNKGADPNQESADHIAPLHLAIAERQPAIVDLLARKKANVNIKMSNTSQKEGMTLLHLALLQNDLESVRSLIKAGADVNQQSGDEGWIPLQLTDNINMINILLENSKIQINATSRDQWIALHWHVEEDNLPIVELLLEKKPDLSLKTGKGDLPLELAERIGNAAMIGKLQEASPRRITNPLPIKKRLSFLTVEGLKAHHDSHKPMSSAGSNQGTPGEPGNSTQDPQCRHTPEEINIARVIAQLNTAVPSQSTGGTPSRISQPPFTLASRGSVIVRAKQFL